MGTPHSMIVPGVLAALDDREYLSRSPSVQYLSNNHSSSEEFRFEVGKPRRSQTNYWPRSDSPASSNDFEAHSPRTPMRPRSILELDDMFDNSSDAPSDESNVSPQYAYHHHPFMPRPIVQQRQEVEERAALRVRKTSKSARARDRMELTEAASEQHELGLINDTHRISVLRVNHWMQEGLAGNATFAAREWAWFATYLDMNKQHDKFISATQVKSDWSSCRDKAFELQCRLQRDHELLQSACEKMEACIRVHKRLRAESGCARISKISLPGIDQGVDTLDFDFISRRLEDLQTSRNHFMQNRVSEVFQCEMLELPGLECLGCNSFETVMGDVKLMPDSSGPSTRAREEMLERLAEHAKARCERLYGYKLQINAFLRPINDALNEAIEQEAQVKMEAKKEMKTLEVVWSAQMEALEDVVRLIYEGALEVGEEGEGDEAEAPVKNEAAKVEKGKSRMRGDSVLDTQ